MAGAELIGRERELTVLGQMLSDRTVRLVTVTGPAGVGKTRVARAVAEALERDGASQVIRVELAPLGDPGLVAAAIAAAAGVEDRSTRGSALEVARAALKDRQALLLLDNFEHLGPAAADVSALLDACPGVTALVTSRHILGISAEHMFPLAPLALPPSDGTETARSMRSPAFVLFVARARVRDPSFELTSEVAGAVAEICRRLDGLPLAIELVAARVAVLPPPALIARWDDAIGLDTPGARDLPPRQQTLRQAFDWSYDLLDPDEQALLRRLAAFPGGFDLTAVETACAGDGDALPALQLEPIPTLALLVDRSLVSRDPGGSASQPRYSQLMTVRGYLRERASAHGEDAATNQLMAQACALIADQAGQFLGVGRPKQELDRLDRELNNMHAALDVFIRTAPERAVELTTVLFGLWQARHVREGRDWVARALAAGGDDVPAGTRARGLWTASLLAHVQGDYGEQRALAADCLAAARVAGDPLTLARALYADAMGLVGTHDEQAGARYRECLALSEQLGDDAGIAMTCNDMGELARERGALDDAVEFYERGLGGWRALGDLAGVALSGHNLALTLHARGGDPGRVGALLREAAAASASVGDRHLQAVILAAVVVVAAEQSPTDVVAMLHGAAVTALEAAGVALDPVDDRMFRDAEKALRSALGDTWFVAASAGGRTLGDEDQRRLVERALARAESADGAPLPAADPLTARQLEIVRLMAEGLTNGEIAQRLVVSDHTVHRHVANILRKLGVPSRAAAASVAARRGLL